MADIDKQKFEKELKEGTFFYLLKEGVIPTILFFLIIAFVPNIFQLFFSENYSLAEFNSNENLTKLLFCMFCGSLIGIAIGFFHLLSKDEANDE